MEKIILIGNGLTSQLIKEYQNEYMMTLFTKEMKALVDKANDLFDAFRFKVENEIYASVAWGVAGDPLAVAGGTPFYKPVSGVHHNKQLLEHVRKTLLQVGFTDNEISNTYFEEYGLVFETQKEKITSIESLLKIVNMFMLINEFTPNDAEKVTSLANKIYYNNGKFRANDIPECSRKSLCEWLAVYKEVYTTNYDMVLDDVYSNNHGVYHLHGGFTFKDKYKKLDTPITWSEAYLIWGINGETKYEQMKGDGIIFPMSFPFSSESSVFEEYLESLQNSSAEHIHIFGYSGENDQHINDAIINNSNIKEVTYYCNPEYLAHSKRMIKEYEYNELFNRNRNKKLNLQSWEEVWKLING